MTKQPYPEEFKIEAVKQITERGHRVADVSARIGVSQHLDAIRDREQPGGGRCSLLLVPT